MKRLFILDGHGYIFRAHFGLMTAGKGDRREIRLSNSEGMPTGALYVFTRMLLRMAHDREPSHMAVVFDAGRKSFRTELYPEYKAHRPPTPDDLAIQLPFFRKIPEAMGWKVLSIAGVEADDVIATLVTQAKARGIEVVILSADKDLMQLVGDGVAMYDSLNQKLYERDDVVAKFGVPPERVADFLALVGDTSDNVPGLAGVGDKTAAKLLAEFGSLDNLIAANPVVPRIKIKQPFSDPAQLARLQVSRELVKLKRDVELGLELDDLAVTPPNGEALRTLFGELEFSALADKFLHDVPHAAGQDASMHKAKPVPDAIIVPSAAPAQLGFGLDAASLEHAASADARRAVRVVTQLVDVEQMVAAVTSSGCGLYAIYDEQRDDRCLVVGLGVAVRSGANRDGGTPTIVDDAWYIPFGHRYLGAPQLAPDVLAALGAMLADPAIAKVALDSKRLTKALRRAGLVLAGVVDDPMIAAFVVNPTLDASLLGQVFAAGGAAPPADPQTLLTKHQRHFEQVAVDAAATVVAQVATGVAAISAPIVARLSAPAAKLYRDIEMPLAAQLADIEMRGICIDRDYFADLSRQVGDQITALEAQIFAQAGEPFNVGSPKQLGHILFDKLGLTSDRMKKTKTGYSTDADVLEAMIEAHPIVRLVLDQRELTKLKGTYLDALPPLVHPTTQRLHTTFNMVVAATGRLSSQDPNLQNIPIRSEVGRKIRRGFVAAPGKVLLAADYSQIELRILAHLSADPVLLKAFRERVDVHTQTACEVFGIAATEVTAQHRRVAKAVNYGLIYGQSDFGLARALDISRREAADYSARYFEKFPAIRAYLASVVAAARRDGGTTTIFGRWRPIAELSSKTMVAKRAAERIAQNTPMQGAGADIIKLAMLATERALRDAKLAAALLLTVHDELVFELAPADVEAASAVIRNEMESVATLSVPLDVDIGVATNWADA